MRALSAARSAVQSRQLQPIVNSADTGQQDLTSILLSGLVIFTYACPPESVSSYAATVCKNHKHWCTHLRQPVEGLLQVKDKLGQALGTVSGTS